MKKIIAKLFLILIIMLAVQGRGMAAFDMLGWGARPTGMGGAFGALADDANAVFWNPAGISRLKHSEMIGMYTMPYLGLDLQVWNDDLNAYESMKLGMNYMVAASPLGSAGSLGLGMTSFNAPDLYTENVIALNYARQIIDGGQGRRRKKGAIDIFAGMNLKYLSRGYGLDARTIDDPVFTGSFDTGASSTAVKGGMNLDLGCLAVIDDITIGLSLNNLLFANLAMESGVSETLYPEIRLAGSYKWGDIVPALDITYKPGISFSQGINVNLGCEAWFLSKTLGVRAGGNLDEICAGFSFRKIMETIGMQVDYSAIYPFRVAGFTGTHRLSLTFQFNKSLYLEVVEAQTKLGRREQKTLAKQYYSRGVKYYKSGKYRKAIVEFSKVLVLQPNHSKSQSLIEKAESKLYR